MDPRDKKLSNLLVNYSCDLQKDERLLIDYEGEECVPLIIQLVKDIYEVGGKPYVNIRNSAINREIMILCIPDLPLCPRSPLRLRRRQGCADKRSSA